MTSTERGIPRYEHPHLVAALDVLLEYQRNRDPDPKLQRNVFVFWNVCVCVCPNDIIAWYDTCLNERYLCQMRICGRRKDFSKIFPFFSPHVFRRFPGIFGFTRLWVVSTARLDNAFTSSHDSFLRTTSRWWFWMCEKLYLGCIFGIDSHLFRELKPTREDVPTLTILTPFH